MEDFAISIILLSFYGSIIGACIWVLSLIIPENLQERIWEKLGLGIKDLPPYEDYDED